jgi:hypothetical protein
VISVNAPYIFLTLLAVHLARERQGTMAGLLFALSVWMVPLTPLPGNPVHDLAWCPQRQFPWQRFFSVRLPF